MKKSFTIAALIFQTLTPSTFAKPLKVFILADQSNMQGHVNVSTFDSLATDPKTAPYLKEMRTADGKRKSAIKSGFLHYPRRR